MTDTELIHSFYTGFQNGNASQMNACYHIDVVFEDPAFGRLEGDRVRAMWAMLLERSGGDIEITYDQVSAYQGIGSASWQAKYYYGPDKRRVINTIEASFKFREGKIIEHIDHFDIWKWSSQALGWSGKLLGWTSFMKSKIRQTTNGLLNAYVIKSQR